MALTKQQAAWAAKLSALLTEVPAGVELILRPGRADLVTAGFEDRVLDESDLHLAPALIERASLFIMRIDARIVPISEAI